MYKLFDFIERHKYGILVSLVIHVGVFIYFQVVTYKEYILFEPWDFQSMHQEAPDNIEITPDQIQTPEEHNLLHSQEEVSSFVKNINDTREKSQSEEMNFTSYAENGNPEQIEKDYEQQLKDEIERKRRAKEDQKSSSDTDLEKEEKVKKEVVNSSKGSAASSKAVGGATMVSYA